MDKKFIKLGDTGIELNKIKTDINRIVVSNKVSFGKKGFKYFICYRDAKKH